MDWPGHPILVAETVRPKACSLLGDYDQPGNEKTAAAQPVAANATEVGGNPGRDHSDRETLDQ